MERRRNTNWLEKPISVYEVNLGSWKRDWNRHNGWIDYRTLAHDLVAYCRR